MNNINKYINFFYALIIVTVFLACEDNEGQLKWNNSEITQTAAYTNSIEISWDKSDGVRENLI